MKLPRVIPILLLKNSGLYKGTKFKDYIYVGDPLNAVKIFNDKEVHELIFLDIEANQTGKINYEMIRRLADECYMPFAYGGGIRNLDSASQIISLGVEKVSLNTAALDNPALISEISKKYGNQCVIVSIDVKKSLFGKYQVFSKSGKSKSHVELSDWCRKAEDFGAGEILLNSIDNDGIMAGLDTNLIREISSVVSVPVIAAGGAGNLQHISSAIKAGASAVAAGSMFVFHSKLRGVLINYPDKNELINLHEMLNESFS